MTSASDDASEPRDASVDAFVALVEAEYEASMRFALRMLRHRADAEDAVQETFLRASQSRARYDSGRSFHAWLFSILVNQCRTVILQRARRARWYSENPDHVLEAAAPQSQLETFDEPLARELALALDTVEPLLREAFLLKHVDQMDYGAMAEVTGASISALKMRVKRATDQIRPMLEAWRDE